MREYRFIDRAILFLRLFVGVLIALHIINKLQTYNFVLTGYPALLFDSSWATFVIFTFLEAAFAVMIILGYGTRFAAFIMALGMFVEIFIIYPSLGWLGVASRFRREKFSVWWANPAQENPPSLGAL